MSGNPRAVISNRIYIEVDEALKKELIQKLTYRIHNGKRGRYEEIETLRVYKVINNTVLSIPQGRMDLIPDHYEIIDKRTVLPVEDFPTPNFPLREDQLSVYEEVEDTCFINALVGWGSLFCPTK